jgi:hypothetical protein
MHAADNGLEAWILTPAVGLLRRTGEQQDVAAHRLEVTPCDASPEPWRRARPTAPLPVRNPSCRRAD